MCRVFVWCASVFFFAFPFKLRITNVVSITFLIVRSCELAFESQCHIGCFYAYVKLKEQEIRNLVYISECILQRRKDAIGNFISVFSKHSEWRCESTRKSGAH